ncbi:hypothetical protein LR392_08955 [Arthrobacter sp. AK04]|jgi:hypothetical protein|uniref:hypothetical protein n=1 Tax=Arthrobacter sp. AK04 TaxID=2900048 RepID=UPI001E637CCF|nr:hypothetical protein [Arthrobacter sp. AK04]MCD5342347.1 hypothetical protein [Arthrobacter sp. AK04]
MAVSSALPPCGSRTLLLIAMSSWSVKTFCGVAVTSADGEAVTLAAAELLMSLDGVVPPG